MARPTTQVISLKKFRGTDRSTKTAKLFHLKRFAIYGSSESLDRRDIGRLSLSSYFQPVQSYFFILSNSSQDNFHCSVCTEVQ